MYWTGIACADGIRASERRRETSDDLNFIVMRICGFGVRIR